MSESPVEVIENKSSLSEKAAEIYKKYDLEATPNRVQIIEHTQQFVEKYQVPESFWADETNLSLLLGCSEKMIGNADPIYKGRIERFSLWLIEPSVPKGLIDVDGIWVLSLHGLSCRKRKRKDMLPRRLIPPPQTILFKNISHKWKDVSKFGKPKKELT